MSARIIRVAAVQFALTAAPDFNGYHDHFAGLVTKAVSAGAQLIVFPEMVTTGLIATHPKALELRVDDVGDAYRDIFPRFTERFAGMVRDLAREHGVWLCGGSHWRLEAETGRYLNTAYFGSPDGSLGTQDKLHLTRPEAAINTDRGDSLRMWM